MDPSQQKPIISISIFLSSSKSIYDEFVYLCLLMEFIFSLLSNFMQKDLSFIGFMICRNQIECNKILSWYQAKERSIVLRIFVLIFVETITKIIGFDIYPRITHGQATNESCSQAHACRQEVLVLGFG